MSESKDLVPEIGLTKEEIAKMLKLASHGKSLRSICLELNISLDKFHKIRKRAPSLDSALQSARNSGLDVIADDLIDIADTYGDPLQARVKSDNIKWLLTKRKPKEYGDQLNINVEQKVSITGAMAEAARRAGHVIDIPQETAQLAAAAEEDDWLEHMESVKEDIFS